MLGVALLSVAHLHATGYVAALKGHARAHIVGVWDDDAKRGKAYADKHDLTFVRDRDRLLAIADAAIICSENRKHLDNVRAAAPRPILCEKPLVTSDAEADEMRRAVGDGIFMTAFPCRYHPAWARAKERVAAIGELKAITATNRGQCPGGWFVEESLAGGGAMIDHTVHVADLLRDLLGRDPSSVYAQTNSRMYGRNTDDTAMLALDYEGGPFVTHDSSWSRPAGFRTWGDVTMEIVGENGIVELDMFGAGLLRTSGATYLDGISPGTDGLMVEAFLASVLDGVPVVTTLEDGLAASRIAIAAYRSAKSNRPEQVSAGAAA